MDIKIAKTKTALGSFIISANTPYSGHLPIVNTILESTLRKRKFT